jgi:hypothetical protein
VRHSKVGPRWRHTNGVSRSVGHWLCVLNLNRHIGKQVLYRLVGTNGLTKLLPIACVLNTLRDHPFRQPDKLSGSGKGAPIERCPLQIRAGITVSHPILIIGCKRYGE